MRILRGKSNLEVSSQGFALFVVGLVLATFVGGAIRTILSSDRVHLRIVSELKSRFPHNEFEIGKTEILLSRGIWPGLGLRLHDVVFKQDMCGKLSFVLNVPQAMLPVDLWSLRHGRVRLGRVEIDNARMRLDYHDCPAKIAETGGPKTAAQGIRSTVSEKGIRPPRLDWKELSKNLEILDLKNFELTYERNLTWKVIFKRAEISLADEMAIQASVDVQKSLPFGTLNHAVELEAQGDTAQNLAWTVGAEFKEGRLSFKGRWNLGSNAVNAHVQLTQLPLKDLSSELYQMGLTEAEIKLKTAWLTCGANWEGQGEHAAEALLQLRACKLEGAYGRVDLEQAEFQPSETARPFKVPAVFHVQKLQIQPLVESLGRQVLPAVIARLGVWTGDVSYAGPKVWQLDGFLENAEIVFSNLSMRGKQLVRSVHTLAQRTETGVEMSLDQVQLQDGEFAGHAELHLGEDWRSGGFSAQIDRLALSPAIQILLIGGQIDPVKLNAAGRLIAGELTTMNAQISVAGMRGEGWRSENLAISAKFAPGVLSLEAKAARAEADSRWRLFPQLQATRDVAADTLAWRDLNVKLDVQKTGGTVNSFTALELGLNRPWRGKGNWVRDGALTGDLLVGSGAHAQSFAVRGEKGSLNVQNRTPGTTAD